MHRHINSHIRSSFLRIETLVRAQVEVSQLWQYNGMKANINTLNERILP